MHAWKCVSWGSPRQLELGTMPEPSCAERDVEITVKACGVNFTDLLMISGRYHLRPELPFVPGMEVAGRVTAVGDGVNEFKVGDKVAAYVKYGGYADKVAAPVSQVIGIDEAVPSSEAAALPLSYGSAELALTRANLGPGEVVVIGGAGGALGSACVELAKQRDAVVIACVGDRNKEKIARECGADHIVSSRSRHLSEDIQGEVGSGVDVIIDPVGGGFFEEALRVLNYNGRAIELGFASGKVPSLRLNQLLLKQQSVLGSSFGLTAVKNPSAVAAIWPRLGQLLRDGKIRPRVSHSRTFKELPAALQMLKDRKAGGHIVLT